MFLEDVSGSPKTPLTSYGLCTIQDLLITTCLHYTADS